MSFYAAQYARMTKKVNADFDHFKAATTKQTDKQVIAAAAKLSMEEMAANAALLRADWPPQIKADIRALVTADGPAIGDLADLASNAGNVVRDSAAANAAANILHADLGLPPVS